MPAADPVRDRPVLGRSPAPWSRRRRRGPAPPRLRWCTALSGGLGVPVSPPGPAWSRSLTRAALCPGSAAGSAARRRARALRLTPARARPTPRRSPRPAARPWEVAAAPVGCAPLAVPFAAFFGLLVAAEAAYFAWLFARRTSAGTGRGRPRGARRPGAGRCGRCVPGPVPLLVVPAVAAAPVAGRPAPGRRDLRALGGGPAAPVALPLLVGPVTCLVAGAAAAGPGVAGGVARRSDGGPRRRPASVGP